MGQTDPRADAIRAAAMAMGCGLLALTGVFSASDLLPADRWFGLCALGIALAALAFGATINTEPGEPTDAWVKRLRITWLAASATGVLFAIIDVLGESEKLEDLFFAMRDREETLV